LEDFLTLSVHVVSSVEVIDHFSKGKLTTEYHYHDGHWDGAEREFRGFGMSSSSIPSRSKSTGSTGLHGAEALFAKG